MNAEKLYAALAAEREKGPLTKERWLAIAEAHFIEAAMQPHDAQPAPVKHKKAHLDALFEALCAVQGCSSANITRSMKGCVVEARKQIMEASPAVTPEEIARRAALYRRRHPTWPLTVTALCKYWGEFAPQEATAAAKNDAYQEPLGEWRPLLRELTGAEALPEAWATWSDIPIDWRQRVKAALQQKP